MQEAAAQLPALRVRFCEGVSLEDLPAGLRSLCTEAVSVEELEHLPRLPLRHASQCDTHTNIGNFPATLI